jgi:hypothetical protein
VGQKGKVCALSRISKFIAASASLQGFDGGGTKLSEDGPEIPLQGAVSRFDCEESESDCTEGDEEEDDSADSHRQVLKFGANCENCPPYSELNKLGGQPPMQ